MNSLELYNSILNVFIQPNYDNNIRYCSLIIDSIIEEINDETKSIFNSPFVCEAIKIVKKESTTLSYLDAYTVLYAVHKKLGDDSYHIYDDASLQDKGYYLFKRTEIHNSEMMYILQIKTIIHLIQKDINENEFDFSKDLTTSINVNKSNIQFNDKKRHSQCFDTKEIEGRIEEQKTKLSQRLDIIQPLVSESLKELLSLKSDFNNLYVLMVGRKIISLYCSIYENYQYHKAQSESYDEQNYKNLINNSSAYLEELEDCLESLGIEIIVSTSGSPFQGKYHETQQTDFNPKNSVILKSVVPGFKYDDDIIVKERVKVQGDNL